MTKDLIDNICEERIFQSIYNKYSKDLHNYLYYKYGDRLNPRDKVQDAFIKLWDQCEKVAYSKAKSFLYTVATNMMLNEVKHQKVVLKYEQQNHKHYTNETPEFILEKEQFLERYSKVLSSLKEEHRAAFLMNKVEDKKINEIAVLLGVTSKVIEYRIYTAFNTLKRELKGFNIK